MAETDRNAAQNPLDEVSVPHPMSKKWIPYKHTNGIAIYLHHNVTEGHEFVGGEYMVSSIVKGSTEQCLTALTHRSSTTTILGPAAAVSVLSKEGNTQVLHLELLPPLGSSFLTSLCAPRHAVIRQTLSKDATGIHCIMFSSIPQQQAMHLLQQRQQQQRHAGCWHHHQQQQCMSRHRCNQQQHHHHHHNHHHHHQRQQQWVRNIISFCDMAGCLASAIRTGRLVSRRTSSSNSGDSIWGLGGQLWSPVLVTVAGGYTISGLEGYTGDTAPESLVTAILKVDLGGWLSSSSTFRWLYQAALSCGVVGLLLERLLTAVPLLKEEVEQQRFQAYPFSLLEDSITDALNSSSTPSAAAAAASRQNSADRWLQPAAPSYPEQQQQLTQLSSIGRQQQHSTSWSALSAWSKSFVHRALPGESAAPATSVPQQQGQHQEQLSAGSDSQTEALSSTHDKGVVGEAGPLVVTVSELSSSAASGATGDVYEQLVGLDAHGQPITGLCNPSFWSELHQPGGPAPFKVRGPQYLSDRLKVAAGAPAYKLLAVDLVSTPAAVHHIARYLPSVRRCRAASCFVINMMVPTATGVMNLVMTFGSMKNWKNFSQQLNTDSSCGNGGSSSSSSSTGSNDGCSNNSSSRSLADSSTGTAGGGSNSSSSGSGDSRRSSSGFDHVLHRFITCSDSERSNIFKMIPHIEVGPWVLKQTVGTTPVIMGRKLQTSYHLTHKYMEVDIDVTTCKTAGYIVQSIRGMTTSLVVDLSYLLEGQFPNELPEVLLGAVRFSNIDMSATTPLDTREEVPYWPEPWKTLPSSALMDSGINSSNAAPAAASAYHSTV